jgi:DNA-binding CsgD family transcriptional regulator
VSVDTRPGGGGFPAAEEPQNGASRGLNPRRESWATSGGATGAPEAVSGPPALTPRERTLLDHLADGLTPAQVGARMHLSPEAVRAAVGRLRDRLGASTTAHMVHRAHELGLLGGARRLPWSSDRGSSRSVEMPEPVLRESALSPKPRTGPADARVIAARLEASFRGGAS